MFTTAVLGNYAIFKRSTHTLFLLSAKTAWPNMIAKHNLQTRVQTRLLPVKTLIVSSDWKWKFVSVITVYNIREFIVMDWILEWHVRIMDEAPNYVTLYKPRLPINLNVSLNCYHTYLCSDIKCKVLRLCLLSQSAINTVEPRPRLHQVLGRPKFWCKRTKIEMRYQKWVRIPDQHGR